MLRLGKIALGAFCAAMTLCACAPVEAQGPQAPAAAAPQSFEQWISSFRKEALDAGISPATFDLAFADVKLNSAVLAADRKQPEFERQIWQYLDGAVSEARISRGRALYQDNKALLDAVERQYGVDAEYIVAIWGIESSYGGFMGDIPVIDALATLAFDSRRSDFAKRELIAVLRILQDGDARKDQLVGSWAGAMGQTQFIPTTYLTYAVDYDGDGSRDLWSNLGDVFASTANYLASYKWRRDQGWGREVVLPEGFDYSLASETIVKSVADWMALGVKAARGTLSADSNQIARMIVPGGHAGPAFLLYGNFDTIMRYNTSTSYALAVAHLGERIAGGAPFVGTWPVGEEPLSRSEREELQRSLAALGYDPGAVDGIVGARTRAALRMFQEDIDVPADGFPTKSILAQLRAQAVR